MFDNDGYRGYDLTTYVENFIGYAQNDMELISFKELSPVIIEYGLCNKLWTVIEIPLAYIGR